MSVPTNRSRVLVRVATSLVAVVCGLACTPVPAIEMFTFFGDGSRIGLPSLEVPIEAYPGIPLRSDRLRARRGWRVPATRGQIARSARAPGAPVTAGVPGQPPAGGRVRVSAPTAAPAPPWTPGSATTAIAPAATGR
ncbi:MAG: hypothetical protein EBR86_01325 [Planctomycetia bacterium]|nr:hypothetical protein [Planctomycetia bacterium]